MGARDITRSRNGRRRSRRLSWSDLAFRRLRTSLPHPHIGDLHHPETPVTQLQPARGTHDLIGDDQRRHQHVIDTVRRIAASYGFDEWATPILEDTRVFARTLGDTSECRDEYAALGCDLPEVDILRTVDVVHLLPDASEAKAGDQRQ